jgi:uncharacterized damage-inducible protein DinB
MAVRQPLDPVRELSEAFDHCARVTEYLVAVLPGELWQAPPPVRGRTIAGIVTHMQGVRRTFAKMGGAPAVPALDRQGSTQAEAVQALRRSREALLALFESNLARGGPRVKGMPRRTVNMLMYLVQHEAHHRGQISMLARALGHRLSKDDVMRIWGWKRLP